MVTRFLTALPVFNEAKHLNGVLDQVVRFSPEVLVVDDGSTDETWELLQSRQDVHVLRHPRNAGYGAALKTAFQHSIRSGYDVLVTIDCDGQHEPQRIPEFVAASQQADIVSGSRYLERFESDSVPPEERRAVNMEITQAIRSRLGLELTDAFCGFKAYRTSALSKLRLTENGYAFPLEVWVQAARHGLKIVEYPVPLIYLDETRTFGGTLDNARVRLAHYYEVLDKAILAAES